MKPEQPTRTTISDLPDGLSLAEIKNRIPDAARRRHLSWGMDFDSRALMLGMKIEDDWEPQVQELHRANISRAREGLAAEFGSIAIESKIENFLAIGTKPMSVLAYHNQFFDQVRRAFVMGDYYPALVGACALGERILNHLILDMRVSFSNTAEYKRVSRKYSFNDWDVPIDTLVAWDILLPTAESEFRSLKTLRHRSIHFNISTYSTLREDALAAILHMRTIIEQQFGSFAVRPWFIPGTKGHVFIKKEYESHPFVLAYFIPRCPFVGPLFGMAHSDEGWQFFDVPDYGNGDWSDEEFAREYNERDPAQVVTGPTSN